MDTCETLLVSLLIIFAVLPLAVIIFVVELLCRERSQRQRNRVRPRRVNDHVGLSMLEMVYSRTISQLVEFILCFFYDAVILNVLLECVEAIVFYLRTVTDVYVGAEEQIRSLKLVVVYALLTIVIVSITIIRCGVRVEPYSLCQEKTALCSKCRRKECEKEIRKGLSRSEQNWLHRFYGGLFSFLEPKLCSNNCKL